MSSLAEMRKDHAELVVIVKELQELVEVKEQPSPVALFDVRRRLASRLIAHLKAEDWALYPPLLESCDPVVRETARRFVEEMGGLAAAFSDFMKQWDAMSIQSDWAAFRTDCQGIIDALTNRIVRENRELYPLLEKLQKAA